MFLSASPVLLPGSWKVCVDEEKCISFWSLAETLRIVSVQRFLSLSLSLSLGLCLFRDAGRVPEGPGSIGLAAPVLPFLI